MTSNASHKSDPRTDGASRRVVIIGAGFGGLFAAKALADAPVQVTVIDRTNHHLFQPLLYQVAMAGLSPAEIAMPIRAILSGQENARVLLGEVCDFDLAARQVLLSDGARVPYDDLIVASGARTSYFGHDEWERYAVGLKDLDDAVEIRRRVLVAFEAAEREPDAARRRALMTFVVVGGGATGVELAGAVAELSRFVLGRDFRAINPEDTRVLLIEAGPRVLAGFSEDLSAYAARTLTRMGVEVRCATRVLRVDPSGVTVSGPGGQEEVLATTTPLWAAGVAATPLVGRLNVPLDRGGRVLAQADLAIPGHPEVFVIGDATTFLHQPGAEGKPLPGVSPVAMQMGRHVAANLERDRLGQARLPFVYVDKGSMATIGRNAAVTQIKRLHLTGFTAWMAWLVVHIFYLIGFRNRVVTLINWAWYYFAYRRGARLITGHRLQPGAPVGQALTGPGPAPQLPAPPPTRASA